MAQVHDTQDLATQHHVADAPGSCPEITELHDPQRERELAALWAGEREFQARRAAESAAATPDALTDADGLRWWNDISRDQRAYWLRQADSARPVDAWNVYRASIAGALDARCAAEFDSQRPLADADVTRLTAGLLGDEFGDLPPGPRASAVPDDTPLDEAIADLGVALAGVASALLAADMRISRRQADLVRDIGARLQQVVGLVGAAGGVR